MSSENKPHKEKSIKLETLKPSDIVDVKMDKDRIFYIDIKHPMLNADVDYEVAIYIGREQKRLEKIHGRTTGIFIDITNYKRLDGMDIFGMTAPAPKTRRVHAEASESGIFKRVAFYKENASRAMKVCVKMVSLASTRIETGVFTDKEKAIKWLKEDAKRILKSEMEKRNSQIPRRQTESDRIPE